MGEKIAARIATCGCIMEWIAEGVVKVTPCSTTCEAYLDGGPERRHARSFIVRIPEEAQ